MKQVKSMGTRTLPFDPSTSSGLRANGIGQSIEDTLHEERIIRESGWCFEGGGKGKTVG